MKKPKDFYGPMSWNLPSGYIDVTTSDETIRHGTPGPDHPYHQIQNLIVRSLEESELFTGGREEALRLAEKILEGI